MTAMPNHETFQTEESLRIAQLTEWMLTQFGEAGAEKQAAFLYQPNFNLGGQLPIDAVMASDSGLRTVQYMLQPVSGC